MAGVVGTGEVGEVGMSIHAGHSNGRADDYQNVVMDMQLHRVCGFLFLIQLSLHKPIN